MEFVYLSILGLLFIIAIISLSNRFHSPHWGKLDIEGTGIKALALDSLSVVTWNIGFGALGAKTDFSFDGGKSLRGLEKSEIVASAKCIADTISSFDADYIILQENAASSFLNRGVNVKSFIDKSLPNYSSCFWRDFQTVFLPYPLRIDHGMSIYSKFKRTAERDCQVLPLPQSSSYYGGVLKKFYAGIVHRIPIQGTNVDWVIINVHLSAFDKGAGSRKEQLSKLFEFAETEYRKGSHVIIGGDWNMRLLPKEFVFKTPPVHKHWIYDLPTELVPAGWRFAVDERHPTVRTMRIPYEKGNNFSMIIDGFAYSPNVEAMQVETVNMEFESADHHPVKATFRTR
jgi:endonuclease/exonuclease/phosphatase family metal-dependent hydrolase